MKQIKLEVGKTYRSREGKEVKIVEFCEGHSWPYGGNNGKWYEASGQWCNAEHPQDLIAEVPETTRHTFAIPEGVKQINVSKEGNRIVVEMVPEAKEPKPGDVMKNEMGSVYIFMAVVGNNTHKYHAGLGEDGRLSFRWICEPGRPATPEEAQPLWDALKKAGKIWNAKTMEVEEIPEATRIREWVEEHLNDGIYSQQGIAEVIGHYLKHKEGGHGQ